MRLESRISRLGPIVSKPTLSTGNAGILSTYPSSFLPTRSYSTTIDTVEDCPSSTCACRETPAGLDIDRASPLDGRFPMYNSHLIVRTGRNDWTSRIEDDDELPLIRTLKSMLTRTGKFANPFHNVMISTSSHSDSSILLWPSMRSISPIPASLSPSESNPTQKRTIESLIRGFLLPQNLPRRARDVIPETQHALLQHHQPSAVEILSTHEVTHIQNPVILICGHGTRDSRCGILGPILQFEFEEQLTRLAMTEPTDSNAISNSNAARDAPVARQEENDRISSSLAHAAVEQISHIGGHKFAGNVILYIPKVGIWQTHPLSGAGVWYGRVEPRHVQGIIEMTLRNGKVIKELFRGGLDTDSSMLKL